MRIEKPRKFIESYLQHRLHPGISVEQIEAALSASVDDEGDSGDGKVTHHWCFLADGQECAIWDYRGLRWSAFGPAEVFVALGLEVIGGVPDVTRAIDLNREVAS